MVGVCPDDLFVMLTIFVGLRLRPSAPRPAADEGTMDWPSYWFIEWSIERLLAVTGTCGIWWATSRGWAATSVRCCASLYTSVAD